MKALPPSNKMLIRMLISMTAVFLVAIPVLVYNLYKIQVVEAADLQSKAIAQQTRDMLISPVRGTVYDRNMIPLAVSATVETIVISPAEIKDEAEAEGIARGLSEILDMDYETLLKRTTNKKSYYEVVARKVDKAVSDAVREFKTENGYNGIKLFEDTKRYYPYSNLASAVLGFTNSDNQGQYGIEYQYESVLKGYAGRIITAKNNRGSEMPFYFEQYLEAQDGESLVLTIDYGAQEILEKNLELALADLQPACGVRGIVMDVKTGAVLAMAQKGDYDLNNPRVVTDEAARAEIDAASEEEKNALYLNALYEQWSNMLLNEAYEPGSVFKIITASIALETGAVSESSSFNCNGAVQVSTSTIHCWKSIGHGTQTFAKAFQNSCNPAFVKIAQTIGYKDYYDYFNAFGFTEKTGIDLAGESAPIRGVHYHTWDVFSNPRLGALVTLSTYGFGQTFKITPIQLITAVSSVVNGGYLMKPYIVGAYADSSGNITKTVEPTVVRQVISEATSKKMCTLLESVVSQGTGGNAYVRGYRVGGKTGTSEKRDKAIALDGKFYIASFCGVAPCDDPQVAVLVIIDEPPTTGLYQGGQIAAPVVGRIMSDLLPYLGVAPVYTDAEIANLAIEVPDLSGRSRSAANTTLKNKGLKAEFVGEGDTVTAQYPAAGSSIPGSAKVICYLGAEPDSSIVRVPDLRGKNYEEAQRVLESMGLYMEPSGAIGSGNQTEYKIVRQAPADGAEVKYGSVIKVEFYGVSNTGE